MKKARVFNHKALNNILKDKGLKAAELSKLTLIPKNTISRYLNGESAPSAERERLIAKALDAPVDAFQMGEAPARSFLSTAEAAAMMGITEYALKNGIINNDFNPSIGSAIRGKGGNSAKHMFHIPLRRVQIYLGVAGTETKEAERYTLLNAL